MSKKMWNIIYGRIASCDYNIVVFISNEYISNTKPIISRN